LNDASWLEAPAEVVMRVLQSYKLRIKEKALFDLLIKWGEFRSASRIQDMRRLVKHIRFCTMSTDEFTNSCLNSNNPLSFEQKFHILHSITQRRSKLLPDGFTHSRLPRNVLQTMPIDWSEYVAISTVVNDQTEPTVFSFAVNKSDLYLFGFLLSSAGQIGREISLSISVQSPESLDRSLCRSNLKSTVTDVNNCVYLNWPLLMIKNVFYTVKVVYNHPRQVPSHIYYPKKQFWNLNYDAPIITFGNVQNPIVDVFGLCVAPADDSQYSDV
jgi:hypothetical protein